MTKQQQQTPTMSSSNQSSSNGLRETRSMTDGKPSHTLQEDIGKRRAISRKTQKTKTGKVDNEGYTLVQRKKSPPKASSPKKTTKISSFFTSKLKEVKPNHTETKVETTNPKPSVTRSSLSPVRDGVSYRDAVTPPTSPKNHNSSTNKNEKEATLNETTNKINNKI